MDFRFEPDKPHLRRLIATFDFLFSTFKPGLFGFDLGGCRTSVSDMGVLRVKNRDFQRATGKWLQCARQGEVIVITSPDGPPLTLQAGHPKPEGESTWKEHLAWLARQPEIAANPVDDLRRVESR